MARKYEREVITPMQAKALIDSNVGPRHPSLLLKDGKPMAIFIGGHDSATDSYKVCDLLNETSRSKGKYP